MEIKGKKFLVTGGAGFIGSHIVDDLLRKGAKAVVIYDNFSSGSNYNIKHLLNDNRVILIQGDILDFDHLRRAIKGVDVVSHQAAQLEIFKALANPIFDLETNIIGTLNVLKAAVESEVLKVINASSACVYGQAKHIPEDEGHPKKPQWPYGASKLSAETYCSMFNEFYGLPVVSLRYGIVYGPREWYGRVLTVFIKKVFEDSPPVIFGDGLQTRDFIHVSDVVKMHSLCIELEESNGQIYNVGTEIKTTIKDLAKKVILGFGKELTSIFENPRPGNYSQFVAYRRRIPGELIDMVLDIRKARRELGWKPEMTLENGILTEIEWFSENPSIWDVTTPRI